MDNAKDIVFFFFLRDLVESYIFCFSSEGNRKSELGSSVSFLIKKLPCAKPTPICGVHFQQANRRSANRTATDNKHSVAFEVLIPPVLPRMKQPDERAAFRTPTSGLLAELE